jgi:hypothetical protein
VEAVPDEDVSETAGRFLEDLSLYCATWKSFDKLFSHFQEQTFQIFSCRTSTSVDARNRTISKEQKKAKRSAARGGKRTGGILLPTSWEKYSRTFLCTHAMPFMKKGTGKRQHTKVRSTGCNARVNVRVRLKPSGEGFHLVVKAAGGHDHPLTEHQWYKPPCRKWR